MGHTYVLEATTNLVPPVDWSRIQTNVADTFGNFSFTNSPLTNAIQFFRIAAP
jgi:hypothetical protein